MRGFLEDLAEHWDDGYWWADRQLLLATLLALISGLIGLCFVYLQVRVRALALASIEKAA